MAAIGREVEPAAGALLAGRYRLERRLGEGGMGVVWSAHDVEEDAYVAIKLLKVGGDSAETDESRRARDRRFAREARAAMSVDHPNVVRIRRIARGDDGAAPFIVMDLLVGESLRQRLDRDPKLPLEELLSVFLPVVSAVGTAHALGVVHRDLKPENIFLCAGEAGIDVRILDFGIAKLTVAEESATSVTATGERLGTPRYMSPEQVYGERDVDHRTDVWSLGMLLYECLAGAHPIRADNAGQVFKVITRASFEPLSTVASSVPAPIGALCMRMLARDRRQRPRDLREVLEVLAPFCSLRVPSFGPPAGASEDDAPRDDLRRTVDETGTRSDTLASADPAEAATRAGPWRSVGSGLIVAAATVLVASAIAYVVTRDSDRPNDSTSTSAASGAVRSSSPSSSGAAPPTLASASTSAPLSPTPSSAPSSASSTLTGLGTASAPTATASVGSKGAPTHSPSGNGTTTATASATSAPSDSTSASPSIEAAKPPDKNKTLIAPDAPF